MKNTMILLKAIEVYETHLSLVNQDYWWGTELEIALQNQVNYLFEQFGIKTEDELQTALDRATLEEMVGYWHEWLLDVEEVEVTEIKVIV